ncbi:hypothetical protein BHM03_00056886 [Ensete ventricosum]|nr:hypothetical protein BHM03_00056886 [Ensete ventricosum]
MKDLFGMSVRNDDEGYYDLYMSDLAPRDPDDEMQARGVLHPHLARELYTLPSEVLLAQVAKEMVWVSTTPVSVTSAISTVFFDVWWLLHNHHYHMALFDHVHDASRLITLIGYQIANLQQEIEALKSGGDPEAVAAVEQRAVELE